MNASQPTQSYNRYNRYNDRDKAAALAIVDACNGNFAEAARLTYLPWTTLRDWKRQQQNQSLASSDNAIPSDLIPVCLETKLARLLEEKIEMMVAAITPERLEECSLPQIIVSLRTVLDRVHTLRTVETAAHHLAIKRIADDRHRLAEILRRYIPDRETLLAIGQEMDEWSNEDSTEDKETEVVPSEAAVEPRESPPSFACERAGYPRSGWRGESRREAAAEQGSRHPSTAAGEGPGVRATPSEAAVVPAPNTLSPSDEGAFMGGAGGEGIGAPQSAKADFALLSDRGFTRRSQKGSESGETGESSESSEISLTPKASPVNSCPPSFTSERGG